MFSSKSYGTLVLWTSFLSTSLCAPLKSSQSSKIELMADCYDYDIPVTTHTEALVWGEPEFHDSYEVAAEIGKLITRPTVPPYNPFSGKKNVTGIYTISATFCSPKAASGHEKTVLLTTHGFGFDSRYWAPTMNKSAYSFVNFAILKGYSVFLYDRLGTGKSTKVSGYSESQTSTQLAILASLTGDIRAGNYTGVMGKPSKIVHAGHSFSSVLTHLLVSDYPSISDGVVLTGIGYNTTDFPGFFEGSRLDIANMVFPGKYRGRDSGYLIASDAVAIAQPAAIMEFVTGSPTMLDAVDFAGAVLILTGQLDIGNCAGDCNDILQHPAQEYFSKASAFDAIVQPNTGHGINFNFNATGAYGVITDFLAKNGF